MLERRLQCRGIETARRACLTRSAGRRRSPAAEQRAEQSPEQPTAALLAAAEQRAEQSSEPSAALLRLPGRGWRGGRRAAELTENRAQPAAAGDLFEYRAKPLIVERLRKPSEHDRGEHGQHARQNVGAQTSVARGDLRHLTGGGARSKQLRYRGLAEFARFFTVRDGGVVIGREMGGVDHARDNMLEHGGVGRRVTQAERQSRSQSLDGGPRLLGREPEAPREIFDQLAALGGRKNLGDIRHRSLRSG